MRNGQTFTLSPRAGATAADQLEMTLKHWEQAAAEAEAECETDLSHVDDPD